METPRWSDRLSRIVPHDADDLDPLLSRFARDAERAVERTPQRAGTEVFPEVAAVLMPEIALKRRDAVAIGLKVSAHLPDAADRAMRLAAFEAERDVEVIVLAEVDRTGLERFGFRTERIAGTTPEARATCEDQIRRFWNIDMVL